MSIVQEAHLPAVDHHRPEEVGHELQATLVELVDLLLIGKPLRMLRASLPAGAA